MQELIFLIREYGTSVYQQKHQQATTVDDKNEFLALANEGMKKAQRIILAELRANLKAQEAANARLKAQRKMDSKDKAAIAQIQQDIRQLTFTEMVYRHLMDSIVWQVFGGKRELIARNYLEEGGSKSLEGSGFNAVVAAAERINQEPLSFALITDLSTNMQVGDLLILSPEGLAFSEVKTGDKNKSALDLFKFYEVNSLDPHERVGQMEEGHFKEQLKRMLKQKATTRKTADIMNNDTGVYQKDDKTTINLPESAYTETTYHDQLAQLIIASKEKDWAYTSIEGIVNVGVYRNNWRGVGKHILGQINHYPVHDLRECFNIGVCEPIFLKPFPAEVLTDIAFGKVLVCIGIDYDQLISFANEIGLPMRWSTTKELAKLKQDFPLNTREIFSHQNKGLVVDDGRKTFFIGMGFMARILFDHNTPRVQLFNRLETFQQ